MGGGITMTNKQKAENMTKGFLKEGLIKKSRIQELLIKAMEWKEQQLIDKAAEWLRMTMDFFNNGEFNTEKLVNDFKQTMKRE